MSMSDNDRRRTTINAGVIGAGQLFFLYRFGRESQTLLFSTSGMRNYLSACYRRECEKAGVEAGESPPPMALPSDGSSVLGMVLRYDESLERDQFKLANLDGDVQLF